MSATKLLGLLMVLVCLCLVVGCEESSESDSSSSSAAGSFGGTWTAPPQAVSSLWSLLKTAQLSPVAIT